MAWLAVLGAALLLSLMLGCSRPLANFGRKSKGPMLWLPCSKKRRRLPPAATLPAAPKAARLLQHEGPCQLHTLLHLLHQQWQELGLGPRRLHDSELDALARRAEFSGGLRPGQPPLSAAALRRFAAWLEPQLAVLQALGLGVCACPTGQLVCGFDVDREEAEAALAAHSPGTFCLRLSSMPGHLVVSLREAPDASRRRRSTGARSCSSGNGSYKGSNEQEVQPAVSHYLFPAERLQLTGLSRALAEVPGCIRLLDVRSGRTHRPSILKKAAAAAAAQWHAAPNAAIAVPVGPLES